MVHCVWHCYVSLYDVFTCEAACPCIISSCLGEVQSSCFIHLVAGKAEALHWAVEDVMGCLDVLTCSDVISEFIIAVDFLASSCFISVGETPTPINGETKHISLYGGYNPPTEIMSPADCRNAQRKMSAKLTHIPQQER